MPFGCVTGKVLDHGLPLALLSAPEHRAAGDCGCGLSRERLTTHPGPPELWGRHDLLVAVVDVVAVKLDAVREAHVLGVVEVPAVHLGGDPLGAAPLPARSGLCRPALDG